MVQPYMGGSDSSGGRRIVEIDIDRLPDSQPTRFEYNDQALLIVRIGDKIYVADDECPHEGCYLSDGHLDVEDRTITCLCHWATFKLDSGESLTPEVTSKPLKLLKSRVEGNKLLIELE